MRAWARSVSENAARRRHIIIHSASVEIGGGRESAAPNGNIIVISGGHGVTCRGLIWLLYGREAIYMTSSASCLVPRAAMLCIRRAHLAEDAASHA